MIFARTAIAGLALCAAAWGPTSPSPPAEAPPSTGAPASAPTRTEAALETPADEPPATDVAGPLAVDTVLPCGLRVIAAQDKSLPVAAVALVVETGTEDDPGDQPGLVHALAYHLLQGNRELAPHGVTQLAHDGGGATALAIGPAQVRYESLVPVSLLDDLLWAESQRLRAPTVTDPLWRDTLRAARRDRPRDWLVPMAALAAIHQADGLAHDGHRTPAELDAIAPRAISTALAERFTYDRATLVVVAPMSPDLALNRVLPLFADLPEAPRRVRDRTAPPRSGSAPRELAIRGGGGLFAWPIAGDTAALAAADAVCRTLQHQRKSADESNRARLRCAIDEDPRRAVLVLRPSAVDDPIAFIRARLQRLTTTDLALLEAQRTRARDDLALRVRTPLGLARRIAADAPVGPARGAPPMRPLAELTGAAVLEAPLDPLPPELAALLDVGGAIRLVEPGKSGAP